ncbi:pyridoxal-phosphate dependent enzyme [Epibacterium sp. SM1979]|uniref:Pyridoxal-phosphate dependent enzyme n=1 Tax=Tritonibacter litoralis TaxID=2662264 RepID=A0A843YIQ6_9RHOB|nr:pyridoxal-phosphate dependent enzyme [Tritonibacter litoralis]MQQ09688.1 pyridoxal-phosphate dependent enzyme [Tritonibacter litoralis]
MLEVYQNPLRGVGLPDLAPLPVEDPTAALALISRCPVYAPTPLRRMAELADRLGVAEVWVKDERARMGLGSFKALGAAHKIARDAAETGDLSGRVYVTASAGNHGLSVAAGAQVFGARAAIYLADTVPEAFANRLRDLGADVVRQGTDYEASMAAAAQAAAAQGWSLLSDSTWPGDDDSVTVTPGRAVMEGYLIMAQEIVDQMETPATHVLLQAGVGGLAAGVTALLRRAWGDACQIIVVEPEAAPAVIESLRAGRLLDSTGPVSNMGRLDCKTPSMVALAGLARDADACVTLSDQAASAAMGPLADMDLATTPSGGAGLAAALAGLDLGSSARVLTILSEGPEDG